MPAARNSKVIYTVITDRCDHLFPPLWPQPGWDLICFCDDESLQADGWQVRRLPALPQLQAVRGDAVRTARLVKILPHLFLGEYEYSLYMDANRVLADSAEVFTAEGKEDLVCLRGVYVDAYAAIDALLEERDGEEDELMLAPPRAPTAQDRDTLAQCAGRWKKEKLPAYGGCPGTALLGRRHNEKNVIAAMETWAEEVLAGLAFDEVALPYACHVHGLAAVQRLCQAPQEGWLLSEAEQLAVAVQHVRLGQGAFAKPVYEENPPPPGGPYDGYPCLLTVGVPVSNQIGTIRRCLDGIRPLLNALPAELLVIDTGSTDGTVQVCREYGARVVAFPWVDDMAAARNAGIRSAKGSWYMSIDDDEWFEDVTPLIDFFKTGGHKKYNMALYNQRNYVNRNMTVRQEFPTPRMARMTPGLHFEGRIHDVLTQPGQPKRAYLPAVANHLGFAVDDTEAIRAKSRRNALILKREVACDAENLRFANQMVKEYSIAGRGGDALRMVYWVLSLAQNGGHEGNAHWRRINAGRGLRLYVARALNGREALRFFERWVRLEEYNDLDTCNLLHALVTACGRQGGQDVAACARSNAYGREYFAARKRFLGLPPPRQDMQWSGMGEGGAEETVLLEVAGQMLRNCVCMRKWDEADALVLGKELAAAFCEEENQDWRTLVMEYLCAQRRWPAMQALLGRFAARHGGEGMDYLYAMLCEQVPRRWWGQVRRLVEEAAGEDAPFLAMLALLEADEAESGTRELFARALAYTKGTVFLTGQYFRARLLHRALQLGQDVAGAFALMDRNDADYAVKAARLGEGWRLPLRESLAGWWRGVEEDAPSLMRYVAFHMAEGDFRDKELNREMEPKAYLDSFAEYIRRRRAWEGQQAAEGLMEGAGSPALPARLRAVCAAAHALALAKCQQDAEALQMLKLVIEWEPSYKHAVKLLQEQLLNESKTRLNRLHEFDALLAGIKPKLRQLLAAGRLAEVRALLAQAEKIAPDDADLAAMKQQLGPPPS